MKYIAAAHHSGTQDRVTRIVIHGTVSPCVPGGAVNVARYFQTAGAGGSAHYVVDPNETVSCLKETVIGWHAPPNTGSIGIELCDPQKGASARWADANHEAMLERAAALVREVAARWHVPLTKLTVAQVKAGKHGVCGHVDVSKAFGQTDHTDPGTGFPWAHFMNLVTGDSTPPPQVADETSFTEDIVKNLPTLKLGANNFDVKTWRGAILQRGGVDEASYGGPAGVKAWLDKTEFDTGLDADTRDFQRSKKLAVDGIVGPLTWSAGLRVS